VIIKHPITLHLNGIAALFCEINFLCLRQCSGSRHYFCWSVCAVVHLRMPTSQTNTVSTIFRVFVDRIWLKFYYRWTSGQPWMYQIVGSKGQGWRSWWGQICPKCTFGFV